MVTTSLSREGRGYGQTRQRIRSLQQIAVEGDRVGVIASGAIGLVFVTRTALLDACNSKLPLALYFD